MALSDFLARLRGGTPDPATVPQLPALPVNAEGRAIVEGRHPEYREYHLTWRWLQDSLEGGQRYREADYGWEAYVITWNVQDPETGRNYPRMYTHNLPRRNLVRHPGEYPVPPGQGAMGEYSGGGAPEMGDEYEFRRSLTPVPGFVQEAIGIHLSRLYAREVRREAPPGPLGDRLKAWWADVDGSGTRVDDWMTETIAPLFLVLGQLDVAFDHPAAPAGAAVETRADQVGLGLDACVACHVLPENVLNWELGSAGKYKWVVVREWVGETPQYRRWTETGWRLYDQEGELTLEGEHPFGEVPIRRKFDTRKARLFNVGNSRYEVNAEIQRTYYNVHSELILSCSLAAHPLLSGPQSMCTGQGVDIGPGRVLPIPDRTAGAQTEWKYVSPSSEAPDKLDKQLQALRDENDRAACLTKPSGVMSHRATVSQSGISKIVDQQTGNDLLAKVATSLQKLEMELARLALTVLSDGPVPPEVLAKVTITYPSEFDLFTASDLAALCRDLQGIAALSGALPVAEIELITRLILAGLPGLPDQVQEKVRKEVEQYVLAGNAVRGADAVNPPPAPAPSPTTPPPPPPSQQAPDATNAPPATESKAA